MSRSESKETLGPCPPGYELAKQGDGWVCIPEGSSASRIQDTPPATVINPCPPGYNLAQVEGNWMCVRDEEAISLKKLRDKAGLRIKQQPSNNITTKSMGKGPHPGTA